MNDKERAAMQQALEALIEANVVAERYQNADKRKEAITALREALAEQEKPLYRKVLREMLDAHEQAEQEPVFYHAVDKFGCNRFYYLDEDKPTDAIPLYAAPVRTKDLTDDEIEAIMVEQGDLRTTAFARAVIAKDREKNK